MSGNLGGFNAENVEPQSFEVIPAGDYEVAIVGSIVQANKAGTGKYLSLELQVLSGQHKGRKLFDLLNLWNPNEKAVEIAKGTLSSICRAVGVLTPNDSADLHNRPLVAVVRIRKDDEYGDKNIIRGYKTAAGAGNAEQLNRESRNAAAASTEDDIPF